MTIIKCNGKIRKNSQNVLTALIFSGTLFLVPTIAGSLQESEAHMVTAEELGNLLERHGYRLEWSKRFATRYAYAAKGKKPHIKRRYLCGEHGLKDVTPEQIERRLEGWN